MEWRPEVLLPLLLAGGALATGWWRLSQRSASPVPSWRLALALSGLGSIALALLSPLDRWAHALFSAHMVQHMLLVIVAPPLLLLADPLPAILWALPRSARIRLGRLLVAGAPLRRMWKTLTWMPVAWLVYALTLWLWHLPALYDAALRAPLLHDFEHLTLFWAGILFWCPIADPAPRLHGPMRHDLRIVYVVLAEGQQALLGLLLSMSSEVLYPSYLGARRLGGLGPLEDQARGGLIMWGSGGLVGMITVLALVFRLLQHEEGPSSPAEIATPGARP